MEKNRLEAFSDGVRAIITIMMVELSRPEGDGRKDLMTLRPSSPAGGSSLRKQNNNLYAL